MVFNRRIIVHDSRFYENNNTKLHLPADGFMLEAMTDEPDESLRAQTINEAFERARAAGRGDVADYLSLKAANDEARAAAVEWLLESSLSIASQIEKSGNFSIAAERTDAHRFSVGNSNLLGARLVFRQTVRCLTVEAGWTRAPADGFMRGGALALARITHFGIGRANENLLLARDADNFINWFAVEEENKRVLFDAKNLRRHFRIFLDEREIDKS